MLRRFVLSIILLEHAGMLTSNHIRNAAKDIITFFGSKSLPTKLGLAKDLVRDEL